MIHEDLIRDYTRGVLRARFAYRGDTRTPEQQSKALAEAVRKARNSRAYRQRKKANP